MNILLCANTAWYIYNFRQNLMRALQREGHAVSVAAPPDQTVPQLTALGVRYLPLRMHQTRKNPLAELLTLTQLCQIIRRVQPDVVLTFTIKCNIYVGWLARWGRYAQIANISGLGEAFNAPGLLHTGVCALYKFAFRHTPTVFFQNQADLETFARRGLVQRTACMRLPGSGVDLTRFTPAPLPSRPQRIFFMFGRLLPQKGYDLFLQAACRLKTRFGAAAEFWILGIEDRARPESRRLLQDILSAQAQQIVTFLPAVADVVPILQQADVVVLPSQYHEGVPKSLLEALACGKPIITTNWKGCRETVEVGRNGYLIEPGDARALENALELLLHADENALRAMGHFSRIKAEREFDERTVIAQYLTAIRAHSP